MDLNNFISKTFTPEVNMYSDEQINDLIDLFNEVGPDHHKAFIETDGYDPDWPIWYSDFLHEKVMDVLDVEFTKSELIYLLVAADLDHQDEAPESDWQTYYANFFTESLG